MEKIATMKEGIQTSVKINASVLSFVNSHKGPLDEIAIDGWANYRPDFQVYLGEMFHVDGVSEDKRLLLVSHKDGRLTSFPSFLFPEFDIDARIDLQERRKVDIERERKFYESMAKTDWYAFRNKCSHELLTTLLSHEGASACINAKAEELKMPVQKYAARLAVDYADCLIEVLKTMPHEW